LNGQSGAGVGFEQHGALGRVDDDVHAQVTEPDSGE
jgi:hypothetical protein